MSTTAETTMTTALSTVLLFNMDSDEVSANEVRVANALADAVCSFSSIGSIVRCQTIQFTRASVRRHRVLSDTRSFTSSYEGVVESTGSYDDIESFTSTLNNESDAAVADSIESSLIDAGLYASFNASTFSASASTEIESSTSSDGDGDGIMSNGKLILIVCLGIALIGLVGAYVVWATRSRRLRNAPVPSTARRREISLVAMRGGRRASSDADDTQGAAIVVDGVDQQRRRSYQSECI